MPQSPVPPTSSPAPETYPLPGLGEPQLQRATNKTVKGKGVLEIGIIPRKEVPDEPAAAMTERLLDAILEEIRLTNAMLGAWLDANGIQR